MKSKQHLNNALVSIRTRLRLTQEQMSLKLGISTSLVKMIETNRRELSVEKLILLAQLEIELTAAKN